MNTITCPRCNTENPANAMNCRQCRINLKFALEHPEEVERIESLLAPALSDEYEWPLTERKLWSTGFLFYSLILIITIACAAILKRGELTTIVGLIWAGGAIAGVIFLDRKNYKPFGCALVLLEVASSGDELGWIALIALVPLLVFGPIVWIIALAVEPREE